MSNTINNKKNVLYIIIPAYNEQDTISKVIKDWYQIVKKYDGNGKSRLIIINDGSTDDTYKVASKYESKMPFLKVINKKNSGHGATVLYGYNYALKNKATYIFQTDSDGQTDTKDFTKFWNNRNYYDMVIGHRNNRKDGIQRIFVTKVLKFILLLIYRKNITDANTPFRLINSISLNKYIKLIPKEFNLSNIALTVIFAKKNLKVKYIPITFRERQGGKNSINLKKIIGIGQKAIFDFIKINRSLNEK